MVGHGRLWSAMVGYGRLGYRAPGALLSSLIAAASVATLSPFYQRCPNSGAQIHREYLAREPCEVKGEGGRDKGCRRKKFLLTLGILK
jgi:hypothetical protein